MSFRRVARNSQKKLPEDGADKRRNSTGLKNVINLQKKCINCLLIKQCRECNLVAADGRLFPLLLVTVGHHWQRHLATAAQSHGSRYQYCATGPSFPSVTCIWRLRATIATVTLLARGNDSCRSAGRRAYLEQCRPPVYIPSSRHVVVTQRTQTASDAATRNDATIQ